MADQSQVETRTPIACGNSAGAPDSEAQQTFDPPQGWTKCQVKSLVLYFFGAANNTGQLYLKIWASKAT